jgi:guanine deaminase
METNNIEINLLKNACELATLSVHKNCGPFGCIITDLDYNEISSGHNMVTELNDPTAHAEIVAIRKACNTLNTFNLSKCRLFTSCEPCPMCLSAIYWSRIEYIIYGNSRTDAKNIGFDDEFIYDELKKDINERKIKLKHIECPEAMKSFNLWIEKTDKTEY